MHTLFYLVLSYCFFHKKSSGARFFKRAPTISDKTFHYFPASVFSRPFSPCRRPENYKIFCGRHSFFRRGRQKASNPKMLPAILHESRSEQHNSLIRLLLRPNAQPPPRAHNFFRAANTPCAEQVSASIKCSASEISQR